MLQLCSVPVVPFDPVSIPPPPQTKYDGIIKNIPQPCAIHWVWCRSTLTLFFQPAPQETVTTTCSHRLPMALGLELRVRIFTRSWREEGGPGGPHSQVSGQQEGSICRFFSSAVASSSCWTFYIFTVVLPAIGKPWLWCHSFQRWLTSWWIDGKHASAEVCNWSTVVK